MNNNEMEDYMKRQQVAKTPAPLSFQYNSYHNPSLGNTSSTQQVSEPQQFFQPQPSYPFPIQSVSANTTTNSSPVYGISSNTSVRVSQSNNYYPSPSLAASFAPTPSASPLSYQHQQQGPSPVYHLPSNTTASNSASQNNSYAQTAATTANGSYQATSQRASVGYQYQQPPMLTGYMQSSLPHASSNSSLNLNTVNASSISRIGSPIYPNQMYAAPKPTFKSASFDVGSMRTSPLSVVNDEYNHNADLNLRKRSYDSASPKSSIAGAVYNSSAVFKRLKANSQNSYSSDSDSTLQRTQGRPFSSNINSRFLLHKNMSTLLQYMEKKDVKQLLSYDFHDLQDNGYNPSMVNKSEDDLNNVSSKVNSGNYKLDDLNVEMFKDGHIHEKLDRFMNTIGKSSKIMSCDAGTEEPIQKQIIYDPPSDEENIENRSPNSGGSPPSLSFILNNNKNVNGIMAKKDDSAYKYAPLNLHNIVGEAFKVEDYQFVKAIRDSNGRILKLESIRPPIETLEDGSKRYKYSTEWVKKTICYPRYKSKMKIHLLRSQENFILYNDLKMMLWDIQEEYRNFPEGELKFQMPNPLLRDQVDNTFMIPVLSEEIKLRLFKDKTVYVKIN